MTFDEMIEEMKQQQIDMQNKLKNISKGIEDLMRENTLLWVENKRLKKQIRELKKDKERLQDIIVILSKPDESQ